MKTKVAVFLTLLASAGAVLAGPKIHVAVNAGPACRPAPVCRPAPICRPVVWRTFSPCWWTPVTAFYPWGPSVVVASNGSGFTTVSPLMNYDGQTPVYRVPPPVLPAQPIITHPGTTFRWRP